MKGEIIVNIAAYFKVIEEAAKSILNQVPKPMNLERVVELHPVKYEESMNTVLIQEVIR